MNGALLLFIGLNLADIGLTAIAVRRLGELQPIMAWMFRESPDHVIASMLLYKGALIAFGWGLRVWENRAILRAANVCMALVVLWNTIGVLGERFIK